MRLTALLRNLNIDVSGLLLTRALTHSSYVNEHPGEGPSNERMEFLGDAVLGLVISDHLYHQFPDVDEGTLSAMRASVVRADTLADVALDLGLGDQLLLGRGEIESGGRAKPSVLADAFEAIVAATYLSQGLSAAETFVSHALREPLQQARERAQVGDPKSELDRRLRRENPGAQLVYVVIAREGPDHEPHFTVQARVDDVPLAQGSGPSKQRAEAEAAERALRALEERA